MKKPTPAVDVRMSSGRQEARPAGWDAGPFCAIYAIISGIKIMARIKPDDIK